MLLAPRFSFELRGVVARYRLLTQPRLISVQGDTWLTGSSLLMLGLACFVRLELGRETAEKEDGSEALEARERWWKL